MRSPHQAMLWELWRVSRLELLLRFAGVLAFVLLVLVMAANMSGPERLVIRGIVVLVLGVACAMSSTWMSALDNQQTGFSFRLGFTRPISTLQLVAIPMAYSVLWAMLGYFLSALLAWWLLGQSVPIAGPAAIIGCIVCIMICTTWFPSHPYERILSLFAATACVLGLLYLRHRWRSGGQPAVIEIANAEYYPAVWQEYAALFLIASLTLAITTLAVGWQRCGEGWRWSALPVRLCQTAARSRWAKRSVGWIEKLTAPKSIHTPLLAQWWFELRRSSHVLLIALALTAVALGFIGLVPLVNDTWGGAHAPRMWLGMLAVCPLVYQLIAADAVLGLRHKQGATQMSIFDATRPLRCDQMLAIKLFAVAGWSCLGLMLMVLAASLHATLLGNWPLWGELISTLAKSLQLMSAGDWVAAQTGSSQTGDAVSAVVTVSPLGWLAIGASLPFMFVSTTAVLMSAVYWWSRFPYAFAWSIYFGIAHMLLYAWDAAHEHPLRWLWLGYAYLIPLAAIIVSLWGLLVGLRAGAKYLRFVGAAICLWCAYAMLSGWLMMQFMSWGASPVVELHPIAVMMVSAGLLAPLAALITSPLALAVHRHG